MKAATVLLSLFVSTTALAQQADPAAPKPAAEPKAAPESKGAKDPKDPKGAPAKEPFVVAAGAIKLQDLIDRCAAYLDCNILYDRIDFAAAGPSVFTVAKAVSTDRDGCLEFLASSLHSEKFVLSWIDERSGMLEVIWSRGPRGREILARAPMVTEAEIAANPSLCMAAIAFVELKHVNPPAAINMLRPPRGAQRDPGIQLTFGMVGRSNGILLSGLRPDIAEAIRKVREIDQPAPGSPVDRGKRIDGLEKRIRALEEQLAASGEKGGEKAGEKGK